MSVIPAGSYLSGAEVVVGYLYHTISTSAFTNTNPNFIPSGNIYESFANLSLDVYDEVVPGTAITRYEVIKTGTYKGYGVRNMPPIPPWAPQDPIVFKQYYIEYDIANGVYTQTIATPPEALQQFVIPQYVTLLGQPNVYVGNVTVGQDISPPVLGQDVNHPLISVAYGKLSNNLATLNINYPNYRDLLRGYILDNRLIPNLPIITITESIQLEIGYYRENKLESIPDLQSIYWVTKKIQVIENIPTTLLIIDCVMGTLIVSSSEARNAIIDLPTAIGLYPCSYLFEENLPSVFIEWRTLYDATNDNPNDLLIFPQSVKLHKLAANNSVWGGTDLSNNNDLEFDITHPMYEVDDIRAYDWHITPQTNNNGIGTLIMDSPRTIETRLMVEQLTNALNALEYQSETPAIIGTGTAENPETPALHKLDWYIKNSSIPIAITNKIISIWKALGGDKYATNIIDVTRDKITNLGWFIENIARVNGLRFDDDGNIDLVKERDLYRHKTIENPSLGLPSSDGKYNDYSMSCFGKIGMIVPHLPTTYKEGGKSVELFDVVHDNQQLAIAILRQQDVSLSIQHGSEIRLKGSDGKVQAYPNQLAVQLECLSRLEKIGYQTEKNLLVSTVAATEVRELFSGIGVPVSQKMLTLADPANTKNQLSVPYFGHQKNKPSTAQLLTTVHVNLALINGVLMPKKQPQASITNPFKYFTPSSKS